MVPGSPEGTPSNLGSGQVVMIVGPDGVGKTALCTALAERISVNVPVRVLAKRPGAERPGVLPHRERPGSSAQPHRHAAYPLAISLSKAVYYIVDFSLGWLMKIVPFVVRGGCVIVERGWWDMLVDPLRYRLELSPAICRVLAHAMPRPTVVLLLRAPSEVITARKAQLSGAELHRQMDAWNEVLPTRQRRVCLDTSRPLDEVVQDALRAVEGKSALTGPGETDEPRSGDTGSVPLHAHAGD